MVTARVANPGRQSAQTAAKASWVAFLVPIGVRIALQSSTQEAGPNAWMLAMVSVVITVGCCLIGVGAGGYALARVRAVGREGVLTPAVIGVLLNGALLVVMILAFTAGAARS